MVISKKLKILTPQTRENPWLFVLISDRRYFHLFIKINPSSSVWEVTWHTSGLEECWFKVKVYWVIWVWIRKIINILIYQIYICFDHALGIPILQLKRGSDEIIPLFVALYPRVLWCQLWLFWSKVIIYTYMFYFDVDQVFRETLESLGEILNPQSLFPMKQKGVSATKYSKSLLLSAEITF